MKPLSGPLQVKMPFETQRLRLAITDIVPLRIVDASVKASRKYIQIAASVREVGSWSFALFDAAPIVRSRLVPIL